MDVNEVIRRWPMLGYLHFSVATFERRVPRNVPEGTRFEVQALEGARGRRLKSPRCEWGLGTRGTSIQTCRAERSRASPSRPYLFGGCLEDG